VHRSQSRLVGVVLGSLVLPIAVIAAPPALAAPGLPPGYQVQRVDSPTPAATGGFGNLSAPIGDVNADGKEDFAEIQYVGSLGGDGIIWEFSGATGQVLRSVNAADPGGNGGRAGADGFLGRMTDIGSCANPAPQVPGSPGPTCPDATIGPPDGANEILVGAGGVDVGGVTDVGRVYVLDGKTLNVLKRIDMPAPDIALIAAAVALPENAPIAAGSTVPAVRGGFGRTATSPRGLPPCVNNAGVGLCPALPVNVRNGDVDGAGVTDVIIGANNFPETGGIGGSANAASQCAASAGISPFPTTCVGAGRSYVYRGEDIAGSNPAVNLNTPLYTLKNLAAQADDPFNPAGRLENFGHSQIPIGDVGRCTAVIPAGDRCPAASSVTVPDGKPDFIISSHRADVPVFNPDPAFFETGVSFLIDGSTGSILYTYNDPEPVANALFGFTTGQQFAVGDLGDTALPDAVIAGFQDVQNKAQAGRGYVFSGNFKANFINFATIDDPTPNTFGRFANPTEGVGDLVGGTQVGNEVLAGQFSAVQTAGKADTSFDVSFMNPANNVALQTISDPDAQPESGFGSRVMPLGDLNGDGFLDFAVSSVRWDSPASGATPSVLDAGRVYIFRSDPNAVVAPPAPLPAGPAGATGAPGAAGAPGATAGGGGAIVALAGRTVDLGASRASLKRGGTVRLRGAVEAFANASACEPGQSVQLQRRASIAARYVTFKTVKTDSKGSFQSAFAPTSTQFYRARVLQTAVCSGAQSSRERVQVIKPAKKKK
jgi:hypothetical protein